MPTASSCHHGRGALIDAGTGAGHVCATEMCESFTRSQGMSSWCSQVAGAQQNIKTPISSSLAFERVWISGLSVFVLRHGHRWWSWPPAKLQTHCLRNEDPRLPLTAREPKSSRYQQPQPLATSRPKGRPLSTLRPSSRSSWLALVSLARLRGAGRHLHPGGLAPNLQD